ncbi:hypothetical protein ACFL7M_03870 [Thermodesulfobacteriota bacterium]
MGKEKKNGQYEVLSPWADTEPIPLKGISHRLESLDNKKIGFFCNPKRAARLIASVVDQKLKEKFPSIETSFYSNSQTNIPEIETENKETFEKWVSGVDTIIIGVGD